MPSTQTESPVLKMNAAVADEPAAKPAASARSMMTRFNRNLSETRKKAGAARRPTNYHEIRRGGPWYQNEYIQPTETACRVAPGTHTAGLPLVSLHSVVMPWPLAPRSECAPALLAWRAYTAYQLLCLSK